MTSNRFTGIWDKYPGLTERLVYLYRAPEMLSYREIAKELSREFDAHVNRNMIVGKVMRLKLPVREVVTVTPTPREAPPAGDHGFTPARPAVPQGCVDFLDLPGWGCKFPYGESPVRFCGQTRWGERPYCPKHCRMAYNPPRERRA